ncbi:DNA translocase FtsK [Butyricicoccus sp.]|uniref:FtsK/SpoIIIE family DNA translocase n=1 Tax=Butyricicoccus sp. TaxID=2049021 RepID=UPI003D7C782A
MANTKKTTTRTKKATSSKKTSAGTRRTTSRSSGAKTTNAASRKRTGTKKTSTTRRTAPKKQPESPIQTGQVWNNVTFGIGLLVLAVILALALCQMDGVLLTGVLYVIGGLIGWGTKLFCLALCAGGMIALCDFQPVRLRVTSALLFPVLWSALAQTVLVNPAMPISFSSIIELWHDGQSLHLGGVIGGMLASILVFLLSSMGAKIVLVMVMAFLLLVIFNTTPMRMFQRLRGMLYEDVEQLREQDMTVSPAKPRTEEADDEDRTQLIGQTSLMTKLRNQRGSRRKAKLLKQQEQAERAQQTTDELSEEKTQKETVKQTAPESKVDNRRRLAEVMPDLTETMHTPEPVQAQRVEPDVPPWEEAAALAEQQAAAPQEEKRATKEEKQQVHQEIARAMDTPAAEYQYPPLKLLKSAPKSSNTDVRAELRDSAERLVDTLASFGIDVQIINIVRGPSVTRFEIQMERGVKFSRITSLSDDIALSLGADTVRIAPIPDKLAVGIEVPNRTVQMVSLRDVIGSKAFETSRASLSVALGKDITGTAQVIDLAKMPHLLIAGTTGSGKSVCINSILISLLYKSSPADVRLIMVDPKMVELGNYNGIPHLLIPVVTDPKKASGALSWAVSEMERRYALFAASGVRGLSDYNELVRQQQEQTQEQPTEDADGQQVMHPRMEHLPQIVIVIDELADLMMVAAKEVETSICRIAQKARAAGMHLVVATQRPSTDVITGLMKSNIPSRIAFAVASQVESRIILDTVGADKLIGKGDMLYSPINLNKPVRIQGCFVSTEEIENVIQYVKKNAEAEYSQEIMDHIEKQSESESAGGYDASEDEDELLPQAITIVVESGQASVSMLQRRLKLGYARAARLVDQMEQRGIVGPFEGSKPRRVLITRDDWMQMQLRARDLP